MRPAHVSRGRRFFGAVLAGGALAGVLAAPTAPAAAGSIAECLATATTPEQEQECRWKGRGNRGGGGG